METFSNRKKREKKKKLKIEAESKKNIEENIIICKPASLFYKSGEPIFETNFMISQWERRTFYFGIVDWIEIEDLYNNKFYKKLIAENLGSWKVVDFKKIYKLYYLDSDEDYNYYDNEIEDYNYVDVDDEDETENNTTVGIIYYAKIGTEWKQILTHNYIYYEHFSLTYGPFESEDFLIKQMAEYFRLLNL